MSIGKIAVSIANLGLEFWAHVLKKPFIDPVSKGRQRFEDNFREDHLRPYSHEQFARLPRYEQCVNCGLCDAACAAAKGPAAGLEPSLIPISVSRAQPLFHCAADLAALYAACGECRACEEACPNGVPIREIAAMVTEC